MLGLSTPSQAFDAATNAAPHVLLTPHDTSPGAVHVGIKMLNKHNQHKHNQHNQHSNPKQYHPMSNPKACTAAAARGNTWVRIPMGARHSAIPLLSPSACLPE